LPKACTERFLAQSPDPVFVVLLMLGARAVQCTQAGAKMGGPRSVCEHSSTAGKRQEAVLGRMAC